MKFLDVKTDFAFKKVFGSEDSKIRLISFLNSVIKFSDDAKIEDLTIVDPYNIPLLAGMKDSYVDVKAVLDNGSKVIIEMQVLNHPGFEKRILYNAAKNYSSQLLEGESYHLLNPIIALTIVDFVMFKEHDKIFSNFKLLEKEQFIDYSDDLEMIFVELPKFTKKLDELSNITDQWLYFIKNAGSLEYIPDNMPDVINSAFKITNTASMTPEELEIQRNKKDFIFIQRESLILAEKTGMENGIAKGMAEGMQKGMAEGIAEGEKLKAIEIATALIEQGVNLDIIVSASGLSKEELSQLVGK